MNIKKNKTSKILKWVARIWSIPIIAYALLLAIGYTSNYIQTGVADPYAAEDYPFIENFPPILMLIAILGLAAAWKWEKIGTNISFIFSLATLAILFVHWPILETPRNAVPYILLAIIVIPAILFRLSSKA